MLEIKKFYYVKQNADLEKRNEIELFYYPEENSIEIKENGSLITKFFIKSFMSFSLIKNCMDELFEHIKEEHENS
jgi:hypothetical protein